METLYYTIIFFLFGLIFGSFFNVVGHRLPINKSIVYPSSKCPICGKKLTFWELIPVISYIIQLGKCKKCKKKISVVYPIFELITGILFALCFMLFGVSYELIIALIFISSLIIIAISDVWYMIIPDEIIYVGSILLLTAIAIFWGPSLSLIAIRDAALIFTVMFLIKKFGDFIFKKESMGGGDIKLMFLVGIVLGFQLSIFVIIIASFIALPVSLIVLLFNKTNVIFFGPFLCLSSILLYLLRIEAIDFYNILINK
jgi:leader peptidase (prepilin peptidase) / N-methyltransferase